MRHFYAFSRLLFSKYGTALPNMEVLSFVPLFRFKSIRCKLYKTFFYFFISLVVSTLCNSYEQLI